MSSYQMRAFLTMCCMVLQVSLGDEGLTQCAAKCDEEAGTCVAYTMGETGSCTLLKSISVSHYPVAELNTWADVWQPIVSASYGHGELLYVGLCLQSQYCLLRERL